MNTINREIKRATLQAGHLFDPFIIVGILLMLILPTLAVLNLSPNYTNNRLKTDVLGVDSDGKVSAVLIGGTHNIITNEGIDFPSENRFKYSSTITNRDKGIYSKPILQLINNSSEEKTLSVSFFSNMNMYSDVSIKYENNMISLVNSNGAISNPHLVIPSNKTYTVYLEIVNDSKILFPQDIEIQIQQ